MFVTITPGCRRAKNSISGFAFEGAKGPGRAELSFLPPSAVAPLSRSGWTLTLVAYDIRPAHKSLLKATRWTSGGHERFPSLVCFMALSPRGTPFPQKKTSRRSGPPESTCGARGTGPRRLFP